MSNLKAKEWANNKDRIDDFFMILNDEEKYTLLTDQEFREFLSLNFNDDFFVYFINISLPITIDYYINL